LALSTACLATTLTASAQCGSRPLSQVAKDPRQLPAPDGPVVEDLRVYFDELGPEGTLWYQHVQTLANPMFEGRAPGTRGGELTVEYLEFFFREYGLVPPFAEAGVPRSTYRQPLSVEGAPVEGFADDGTLEIAGKQLAAGTDFVLTANSARGDVAAPVTFVGYGIENGPGGYTSFGPDTDLNGRVASPRITHRFGRSSTPSPSAAPPASSWSTPRGRSTTFRSSTRCPSRSGTGARR
jgi:hypothetical protein